MKKGLALAAALIILTAAVFGGCTSADTDYLSWSYEDWSNANEAERLNCAAAYAAEVTGEDNANLKDAAKTYKLVLEEWLKANPGATVGEIAEMAAAAKNSG